MKFDPTEFWIAKKPVPWLSYGTVEELVQNDKNFKKFKKERPKAAALLVLNENIVWVKDMVFGTVNDNPQAGRMLMHLIEGNRKSKEFTGVHHLPNPLPEYILNFRVVEPPNHQGVYIATFDIQDQDGRILNKQNVSTLFPSDWSKQRVYDECLFAFNNKREMTGTVSSYVSETISRIPVEIHLDEDNKIIKTLYPIRVD